MTSEQHATQLAAVRASLALDASSTAEKHACFPARKPLLCMHCAENPPSGYGMCDSCRQAWLAQRATA